MSTPGPSQLQLQLIQCAGQAGLAVREAIARIPVSQRVKRAPTPLKPPPALAALPDLHGEKAAFEVLRKLAEQLGCEIRVVVDPASGSYHAIPPTPGTSTAGSQPAKSQHVYAYLDAVDGTVKLAGLGNSAGHARVVNDGAWAVGLAFTEPTDTPLSDLRIADFSVACIIDGAAPLPKSAYDTSSTVAAGGFPAAAVAYRTASSAGPAYQTHALVFPQEGTAGPAMLGPPLVSSSCTQLGQVFAYLDAFQAFDQRTQGPIDEQLATGLYTALINRNKGGAFDVLRTYGNLSALLRTMLGWGPCITPHSLPHTQPNTSQHTSHSQTHTAASGTTTHQGHNTERHSDDHLCIEPQAGVYVVVNENLANLIPCVPIVLGAGCVATDLESRPLVDRTLSQGRTSVVYSGNRALHESMLQVIDRVRSDIRLSLNSND